MCINYTNLNKAIPKKLFPLPRIDKVVDAVTEHEVLCFLDAYKIYHRIPIVPEDMEKMTFVTDDGIFCYTRMPKNVQAEFQQMVNDVFGDQIGRNIEFMLMTLF